MQTAAAYIRVSTEDQIEYSPDSQLKKIQEYARSHDFLLPENLIFLDEGISGRSAQKRPAFMKMIGMAKQNPRPFDLILVWKFSRFARNRQDSIFYKSMLRKDCGIQVISITEQLSEDPTSILVEALLEAMDEYYSINLAQEVRRGMNEKFSRGGVVSVPPFGYRMGTEYFEPDPEKAPFIPMIYQNFLNGMSCRQIAVRLNELGIRTARGNLFESRSIKYILTNPVYTGKLCRTAKDPEHSPDFHGRQDRPLSPVSPVRHPAPADSAFHHFRKKMPMLLVDGKHLPLIDQETFLMVQDQIAASQKAHTANTKAASVSCMLHGLVRCSSCGSTLTLSEKGRSLQCHRYAKGLCGRSHHIRLDILNQAFLSALEADLLLTDTDPSETATAPTVPDPAADPPETATAPAVPKTAAADPPETAAAPVHPKANRTGNPDGTVNIRIRRPDSSASETNALSHLLKQEAKRMERIKAAYEAGIDDLEEYRENRRTAEKRIQKLKDKLRQSGAQKPQPPEQVTLSLKYTLSLLAGKELSESAKNELLKAFISHILFDRSQNTVRIYYHI